MDSTLTKDKLIAFMDIGTNSVRLLLVENSPDIPYRIITQQKETVRLGEDEFRDETLKPEAIKRTVNVCKHFSELALSYGVDEIIAVATSATRDAKNKDAFLRQMQEEAGVNINIISGKEEARLIYLGVISGINLGLKNGLFVDIGGGSTEIIVGNQNVYHYLDSLKLGAIRLSTIYLADETGPITTEKYQLLQQYVRNTAIRTFQSVGKFPLDVVFGSSGTIQNLAEVTAKMFFKRKLEKDEEISYEYLKKAINTLCSLSLEDRRNVPGINPERADIIIGGAAIIDTIMADLKLSAISISDRGLREGLLIDYLSRSTFQDSENSLREQSVLQLGRSCGFDEFHANKVSDLALNLYDSLCGVGLHQFQESERELLEYAALLHDIGSFLSYHNHHAHTYYLIRNAELLGFNQAEIAVLAAVAYYHRKALPRKKHKLFSVLKKSEQELVRMLSIIIRIAETLDRSHIGLVHHAGFCSINKKTLLLEVFANKDCQLELWGLAQHGKAIKEVLKRKLLVKTELINQ